MICKPLSIYVRQILLKVLKIRRPDPLESDRILNSTNAHICASFAVQANELAGS
jgi:hypothetical protein